MKYEWLFREEINDGLQLVEHVNAYRHDYNHVRPHEAIAWNRPADVYAGTADPTVPNFETKEILPTTSRGTDPSARSGPRYDTELPSSLGRLPWGDTTRTWNRCSESMPQSCRLISSNLQVHSLLSARVTPLTCLHHFRDLDGLEVDLIIELADGRLLSIEVKSSTSITGGLDQPHPLQRPLPRPQHHGCLPPHRNPDRRRRRLAAHPSRYRTLAALIRRPFAASRSGQSIGSRRGTLCAG